MINKISNKARSAAYVKMKNVMYSPKKNKIKLATHDDLLDIYYSKEWEYIGPYDFSVKEDELEKK